MVHIMKKIAAFAAGCLVLALVWGSLPSPASGAASITLSVVYYYTSEAEKEFVQKMLDEYQQQHPGIKLDIQVTTQGKWPEIMTTRAIAKQLPDVAMSVPQRVGDWYSPYKRWSLHWGSFWDYSPGTC